MKRFVVVAVTAALTTLGGTGMAAAAEPAQGMAPALGQHVAAMAPAPAIAHGADFGSCVAMMAQGAPCPHTH